jgi:hypothetical protein
MSPPSLARSLFTRLLKGISLLESPFTNKKALMMIIALIITLGKRM